MTADYPAEICFEWERLDSRGKPYFKTKVGGDNRSGESINQDDFFREATKQIAFLPRCLQATPRFAGLNYEFRSLYSPSTYFFLDRISVCQISSKGSIKTSKIYFRYDPNNLFKYRLIRNHMNSDRHVVARHKI